MFPDDFFGKQDSKTNNFRKKIEHPKLLNPQIIPQNKNNKINVIKEEPLEESTETHLPKKNGLKIIIPPDSSNEDNSTTESSRTPLTSITPNIKNNQYGLFKVIPCSIIDCKTSTNSLKDNELTRPIAIKEKIITQKINKNTKFNVYQKEKCKVRVRSVSTKKKVIEKDNNVKKQDLPKRNRSESCCLKNKQCKNNNTVQNKNYSNVVRTNKRSNSVGTNRIKDVKNNKNKSLSCDKKSNNRNTVLIQKTNKTNIVHLKVEKEINNIFKNLPEDYEIAPEIQNKFELLMKNIYDIKNAISKKTQKDFHPRKSRFEKKNSLTSI